MRAVNRAFVLSVVRAIEPRAVQENLVNAVFIHGCYYWDCVRQSAL